MACLRTVGNILTGDDTMC